MKTMNVFNPINGQFEVKTVTESFSVKNPVTGGINYNKDLIFVHKDWIEKQQLKVASDSKKLKYNQNKKVSIMENLLTGVFMYKGFNPWASDDEGDVTLQLGSGVLTATGYQHQFVGIQVGDYVKCTLLIDNNANFFIEDINLDADQTRLARLTSKSFNNENK